MPVVPEKSASEIQSRDGSLHRFLIASFGQRLSNATRPSHEMKLASWRLQGLKIRVHVDAFRFSPLRYIKAVGWRIRGLRLRSRNTFAELKGRSSHAYALWIATIEPQARKTFFNRTGASVDIVTLIDCTDTSEHFLDTLRSLGPDPGRILVVGGEKDDAFERVCHPREIASLINVDRTWLCIVRCGDRLSADALTLYAKAAMRARSSVLYADDDLIGSQRVRQFPHFKPSWNPELFVHHDFLTHSSLVKTSAEVLREVELQGWASSVVQSAISKREAPTHLPIVLHHRKSRPSPILPASSQAALVGDFPSVTAIVPTRNGLELLRCCIEGINRTNYPNKRVVIVDNGSDDAPTLAYLKRLELEGIRVLRLPGPFNYSALNNAAVIESPSDLLCFLNNDVEILEPSWLSSMVVHAMRSDIGAVGARLLYPDGTVQHAGVFTGIGGGAGHAHRFQKVDEPGYFSRASLPQRVSAVTAACLVVAREKFVAVGGFDETRFPVAFNDVDLCLKLNARGWQSFYEPRATLIHHESKSRGNDSARANRKRFAGELSALKVKWLTDRRRDPYHHPQLSNFCEQFVIAV